MQPYREKRGGGAKVTTQSNLTPSRAFLDSDWQNNSAKILVHNKMEQSIFLFSLLILVVTGFDGNALNDAKKKVSEGLDQLPDNVKNILPTGLDINQLPSEENGEELLKKKCQKYGNNESFDKAMAAKEEIQSCVRGLVNYTVITQEIEKAKPTGDLDVVFAKYCRKSPLLKGCITNLTNSIEPCLSPDERTMKTIITNIYDALDRFICYKQGDRIALFIAEKGPECLKSKQEEIQQCLNSTFSAYIPKEMPNKDEDLPPFRLTEKECGDVSKLQRCIVDHLEKCSEPTPANIIDSIFTYVRKSTPCQQYTPSGR